MDVVIDRAVPKAAGLNGVLVTPKWKPADMGVVLIGGRKAACHERDAVVLADAGFTMLAS